MYVYIYIYSVLRYSAGPSGLGRGRGVQDFFIFILFFKGTQRGLVASVLREGSKNFFRLCCVCVVKY